ncbi:TIGR00374 family protein [Thermotoga maritima]|uniref:TIGR00374 family protein n=1 Tax=Thermotoga maritima TaxID=2336 RepID=UPI0009DB2B5F|nr:TIGR00374 family protein [Thermotoga maritima]
MAFGFLAVVFIFREVDPAEFSRYFHLKSLLYMFLLCGTFVFSIVIDSLRMKWLYSFVWKEKFPLYDAFFNNYMSFVFSMLTPFYFGGQFFQTYHLSKMGFKSEHNVNVILSRFVEYLISVTVLSILGLVRYRNFLFSNALLTSKLILLAYLISVLFIAVLMSALINPPLIARLFNAFKRIRWIDRLIKKITKAEDWDTRFLEWTEKLKESVQVLWKSGFMFFDFPLTFISLLVQSFVLYLAIWLTSGKIGFLDVTGLFYFLSLVVFYIPTPGASGGVEAVYQIVFSKILNSSEKTLASILIWRISTYYLPIFIGIAFLLIYRYPKEVTK